MKIINATIGYHPESGQCHIYDENDTIPPGFMTTGACYTAMASLTPKERIIAMLVEGLLIAQSGIPASKVLEALWQIDELQDPLIEDWFDRHI